MKNSNVCPKCQSRVLWAIDVVRSWRKKSSLDLLPMPVTAAEQPGALLFLEMEVGHFEAWVCDSCGYTEWYARDFREGLRQLAADPENGIRLVDKSASRGPFR